jgi:hypothetical protein
MSSNLPSLIGPGALAVAAGNRDVGRVRRTATRDVALVQAKAYVLAERGRANTQAIESVSVDAMQAATQIARHATTLAASCPVAENMLRSVVDQAGLALGQTVADTARDLR